MTTYSTYSDGELVRMLSEGDRAAFEAIYSKFWQPLYNIVYKRLGEREHTEDVLQDVFARFWVRREKQDIENLGAYLSTAVRYEVIRFLNRNKSALYFYQPFEEILLEIENPEGKLLAKEMLEAVYAYGETLPEKRKAIFFMHIKSKLSTAEIADQLGISQKTVQNQLGTSLQGLKTKLAPVILALIAGHLNN